MTRKPYRNGRVHVMHSMCSTCIFRPGNLMHLESGHVLNMVQQATKNESAIICHETLDGEQAVCHGFLKLHATIPLRLAECLKVIKYIQPGS